MSDVSGNEFIHIPTFAEYFTSLGYEQKLALTSFYLTYCVAAHDTETKHLDDRPGNFPFAVGHVRSADNTLYVANSRNGAHENPDDYLLVAAGLHDNTMHVDELEVLQVKHQPWGRYEGIDKIINAKWHETSKRVSVRLGHQASVTTQDSSGLVIQSPTLAID
ncbi:MAG: hypothetical protein JWO07_312 [Candidatus Saccharibacteria bacterium]|nr:hypothetical protein [Candidatus Saccharibacteria bacterium]